eukprot:754420-Hanusia_phi.AAC.1
MGRPCQFDGGALPLAIEDGGFDMFDFGNQIIIQTSFDEDIWFLGNPLYYGVSYLKKQFEVFVGAKNTYPHITSIFLPQGTLRIICKGNTGSDGLGTVLNYELQYAASPEVNGTIWANINFGTSNPTIGDIWFTVQSTAWGSELKNWTDGRKLEDSDDYEHYVEITGENIVFCKMLLSRTFGSGIEPWEIASYVSDYVREIPFHLRQYSSEQLNNNNKSLESNLTACRLDVPWKTIVEETSKYKTGGLGPDMITHEVEVWVCAYDHPCSPTAGDAMCFKYNESSSTFLPWGTNSELQVIS